MSQLRVCVDEQANSAPDDTLLDRLLAVVRELVPEHPASVSCNVAMLEVLAFLQAPTESNIGRFVESILALSRSTGRSFTVVTAMDDTALQAQVRKFPQLKLFGGDHIVHVRPGEEASLRSYFRFLFGAP